MAVEEEEASPPHLSRSEGLIQLLLTDFLVNMSASADVLAQAKVEVGLGAIPEGKNVRDLILHCVLPPGIPGGNGNINMYMTIGYHQVAWQARLYPSPYSGGDRRGQQHRGLLPS